MGLMVAVELVRDRQTKTPVPKTTARVLDGAKRRGQIVGRGGLHANVLRIGPPLIVRKTDVEAAIDILDDAFTAAPT